MRVTSLTHLFTLVLQLVNWLIDCFFIAYSIIFCYNAFHIQWVSGLGFTSIFISQCIMLEFWLSGTVTVRLYSQLSILVTLIWYIKSNQFVLVSTFNSVHFNFHFYSYYLWIYLNECDSTSCSTKLDEDNEVSQNGTQDLQNWTNSTNWHKTWVIKYRVMN
jgi:hypothetical protein